MSMQQQVQAVRARMAAAAESSGRPPGGIPRCAASQLPSARTIRLLREAGAAEVHYRISAPPFAHPCYFGTDIPDEKDLIATGHTVEEINELVGSDTLGYLSIEHVQQLAIHSKCGFCTGCFTGKYPVAPPTETMDIVYDKPLSQSKTNKKL